MHRRALLTAIAALGAGCLGYVDDETREELVDPEGVDVVWDTLVRENPGTEDERVSVWGVVRSEEDRDLQYLEIRATFLDAEGEELASVIEHVDDVREGREWEFEVEFPDFGDEAAGVVDYELEVVTSV